MSIHLLFTLPHVKNNKKNPNKQTKKTNLPPVKGERNKTYLCGLALILFFQQSVRADHTLKVNLSLFQVRIRH